MDVIFFGHDWKSPERVPYTFCSKEKECIKRSRHVLVSRTIVEMIYMLSPQ